MFPTKNCCFGVFKFTFLCLFYPFSCVNGLCRVQRSNRQNKRQCELVQNGWAGKPFATIIAKNVSSQVPAKTVRWLASSSSAWLNESYFAIYDFWDVKFRSFKIWMLWKFEKKASIYARSSFLLNALGSDSCFLSRNDLYWILECL